MLKATEDRYAGITVDKTTLPQTATFFKNEIEELISALIGKKLLWVKIPIEKSDFIPTLTQLHFEFHHCDERNLTLVKKLVPGAIVPTTKNFIVGVGAIVLDAGKLLVIKDRFSPGYKLPGGHIDHKESIKDAVKREVFEETGVHIEFESIMNLGHFKHGQFGEANIYLACTAKPLSKEITIYDASEIVEARWIDLDEFLSLEEVNAYNKGVVRAAINNEGLKLTEQDIRLSISDYEVFF